MAQTVARKCRRTGLVPAQQHHFREWCDSAHQHHRQHHCERSNVCSIDGSPGGNQSPELSWTGIPAGTASFVVTAYDTTAAFTHWGMYNVSALATGSPKTRASLEVSTAPRCIHRLCARYDSPPAVVAKFSCERRISVSGADPGGKEPPYFAKFKHRGLLLDNAGAVERSCSASPQGC